MSFKSNLIILESSKGFSAKLREYFQGKGVSTYLVSSFKDATSILPDLAFPIVLVDLPDNKSQASAIIEQLKKFETGFGYPLFVLGKEGPQAETQLNGLYKLVTGIRKPVSNMELYEAIKYTSEAFEFPAADPAPSSVPDDKKKDGPKASGRIEAPKRIDSETISAEQEAHELYSVFSSIPELFFSEIDSYQLLQRDFSGIEYTRAINPGAIKDKSYLPRDEKVLRVVDEMKSNLVPWQQARLHRTSFMSNSIVQNLTTDEKIKEEAKVASLLCNWSVAGAQRNLLGKDYVTTRSRTARKDLCSRMKDSAMRVACELNLGEAANIVAKVGRLIGKEEKVEGDNPLSIVASAIATADMVDRVCWSSHYFNPRAAYRIMYMAKNGELSDVHPAVLCSVIKLLAEAIASSTQLLLIPKEQRKDPILQAEAKRIREQAVGENEEKVSISDLTPGMRLSQPLVAFDGKEVLEEDLILDQDLIWRIWQLALIRPLNAPLVVARSNGQSRPA
ncbi:MAG: hypothetical protein J5J00_09410 [Deltaproteobacteria bacterium]|nr:hypothetical protein [Deltaproteobacteria bacterium]